MSEPLQFTKEELLSIAKNQSNYCWLIFGTAIFRLSFMAFSAFSYQSPPAIPSQVLIIVSSAFIAGSVGIVIAAIIFMYRLTSALRVNNKWLYLIALFIPLVNLLVILYLITSATKVLRANNIRVGLMGANKEDLNKLEAEAGTLGA